MYEKNHKNKVKNTFTYKGANSVPASPQSPQEVKMEYPVVRMNFRFQDMRPGDVVEVLIPGVGSRSRIVSRVRKLGPDFIMASPKPGRILVGRACKRDASRLNSEHE